MYSFWNKVNTTKPETSQDRDEVLSHSGNLLGVMMESVNLAAHLAQSANFLLLYTYTALQHHLATNIQPSVLPLFNAYPSVDDALTPLPVAQLA
ncbi:MAG: hypothetical protein K0S08_1620 [Gammaproteobacteria bacterium]|jgi:hypothetical protein|nr:hypothetical protein [Gammaproteobacteria bacterium]